MNDVCRVQWATMTALHKCSSFAIFHHWSTPIIKLQVVGLTLHSCNFYVRFVRLWPNPSGVKVKVRNHSLFLIVSSDWGNGSEESAVWRLHPSLPAALQISLDSRSRPVRVELQSVTMTHPQSCAQSCPFNGYNGQYGKMRWRSERVPGHL